MFSTHLTIHVLLPVQDFAQLNRLSQCVGNLMEHKEHQLQSLGKAKSYCRLSDGQILLESRVFTQKGQHGRMFWPTPSSARKPFSQVSSRLVYEPRQNSSIGARSMLEALVVIGSYVLGCSDSHRSHARSYHQPLPKVIIDVPRWSRLEPTTSALHTSLRRSLTAIFVALLQLQSCLESRNISSV